MRMLGAGRRGFLQRNGRVEIGWNGEWGRRRERRNREGRGGWWNNRGRRGRRIGGRERGGRGKRKRRKRRRKNATHSIVSWLPLTRLPFVWRQDHKAKQSSCHLQEIQGSVWSKDLRAMIGDLRDRLETQEGSCWRQPCWEMMRNDGRNGNREESMKKQIETYQTEPLEATVNQRQNNGTTNGPLEKRLQQTRIVFNSVQRVILIQRTWNAVFRKIFPACGWPSAL